MPFKKVGANDYTSPTGRHFNQAQVRLYYANGGHFPGEKHAAGGPVASKEPSMARSKSYGTFNAAYAAGGPVLGRTREFIKSTNEARDPEEGPAGYQQYDPGKKTTIVGDTADSDQRYGKSGAGAGKGQGPTSGPKRTGDKSLKAVKPRR